MRFLSYVFVIFFAFPGTQISFAQTGDDATVQSISTSQSGRDYLKSIRFSRIQGNVVYYDPAGAPPSLDTNARPAPPPSRPDQSAPPITPARWVLGILSAIVIATILWIFYQSAGGVSLSLGSNPNARRGAKTQRDASPDASDPPDLSAILAIADRRVAVIALARSALFKSAQSQGLILQRSWTARDSLRRIARSNPNVQALRALIMVAERVHFGNRDISDTEFDALVAGVRPMYGAVAP